MASTGHKGLVVLLCAAGVVLGLIASARADVTGQEVRKGIQTRIADLRAKQGGNGHWQGGGHSGGCTALAVLALLNAGVPANDPAVVRGVAALKTVPDERTYVVALKAQAYAAAGMGPDDEPLKAAARFLVKTQLPNGMWSYGLARGRVMGGGDNSNTQFALLGLHEAAKAGLEIPEEVWKRSGRHFVNTQGGDGGWGYRARTTRNYGSMTAAGLASLYICGQRLHVGGQKVFVNGIYPNCGKYQENRRIAAGLQWLAKNFSVTENPGRGQTWLYYYLYALERVGMISGRQHFGEHDWYREGAEFLLKGRRGGGRRRVMRGQVYDDCFQLLFLAKGNRPVLFQKIRWEGMRQPDWNRNIHDLEHLTQFIGEKLGKRTTWQTVDLDQPVRTLRVSPILYMTGHEFPILTPKEKQKLFEFTEAGGTLLFEACCGHDAFDKGFRQLARELWERQGYPLRKLDESHPVFSSYYELEDTYDLHGINVGCRTSVFYSPRALSSLWELQTIPKWSEKAFRMGTNIAAYATGREQLADKLDEVDLPERAEDDERAFEVPRGAVRLARLWHTGDYNADPKALVNLAALVRDKAKVDVVSKNAVLKASDKRIYEYPVVFMNGHYTFSLGDKDVEALRKYLRRGGFLMVSACCGQKAFDRSFREQIKRVFPDQDLEPLPDDHPLYTGKIGVPLGELRYRKILADELKAAGNDHWRGTDKPPLEAITLDGRTALIYSKYDWCCALEGDSPYSCRGFSDADGQRLALNILLYAITY